MKTAPDRDEFCALKQQRGNFVPNSTQQLRVGTAGPGGVAHLTHFAEKLFTTDRLFISGQTLAE